ncbi:MAG: hypothetical protein J6H20_06145, partial [Pyramidobacter sp.]|nr:hypothetical protein [Pyramidobacter sp.]
PPSYDPNPEPGESVSPGVYAMPQGQGFHRFGCKFIRDGHGKMRRGLLYMTSEEALHRGYRPCRTCFPGARY